MEYIQQEDLAEDWNDIFNNKGRDTTNGKAIF